MSKSLAVEFPSGALALTGYSPPVARRSESAGDLVTSSSWPRPAGRRRFLADASSVLDASLDYESPLAVGEDGIARACGDLVERLRAS